MHIKKSNLFEVMYRRENDLVGCPEKQRYQKRKTHG